VPVRLTLYTKEESKELIRLGAVEAEVEFCPVHDLLWASFTPVRDAVDELVGLSVWSGHEQDDSLRDWIVDTKAVPGWF